MTAWEVCPSCAGSGLQDGMNGPVACSTCGGQIVIRLRDGHGRYTTRQEVDQ